MTRAEKITGAACVLLLAAALGAAWWTRDTARNRAQTNASVIDRRLLDSARQLAPIAETASEQELARQAARLADHELDQAFESAVREAAARKPQATPALQQLNARLTEARKRIDADQARIAKLQKIASADDQAAAQLEVAKAQLALDQDELEDAQLDLARQGGDDRARLEQAAREHADAQAQPVPVKATPAGSTATLAAQFATWLELRDRTDRVDAARQQAARQAATLERDHNRLEAIVENKSPAATPPPDADDPDAEPDLEDPAAAVARLRGLADQRKTLTELDRRIQDCRQLEDTYKNWRAILETRERGVLHLLLGSLVLVFGIVFGAVAIEIGVRRALQERDAHERRRQHQKRFLVTIAIRVIAALAILLVLFGPPGQMPTIIGLATAGMTVVLKDFIVAFFGWFILIGRNGVRVGDWVEINGIGGEVIEIGVFKTVLLEMGSWSTTGHPTGRRVSFMNGYAIEGHYFNFSTAGQWLWDQLSVAVPSGADPYGTAERIREAVERETEGEAQLAEQDWDRITKQYGTRAFSARPAVDLRPGLNGLEVHVRYITRGPQRYEVKSRLFKAIVGLLHQGKDAQ